MCSQLFLEAPDAIGCFRYNPTNPAIIAGGCVNGQVTILSLYNSHCDLIVNRL